MSVIQVEVDESIADLLGDSPAQIERTALEMIVLDLYRQHVISAGRGAEILNLDLLAFARWSGARGVPYFDTDPEDWENQLRAINKV